LQYDEWLAANIDGIDTALLAFIGGILAIGKIAIDKIRELEAPYGTLALSILASTIILSGTGYIVGPLWGIERQDANADVSPESGNYVAVAYGHVRGDLVDTTACGC
jgi:hypothetical protein